ncbi:MAG: exodeoxyribonuclease V subunit alpha [Bacteroidota bacterium]
MISKLPSTMPSDQPAAGAYRTALDLGLVEPLDVALAGWLSGRDARFGKEIGTAVLLLSLARRDGHTALHVAELGRNAHIADLTAAGIEMPSPDAILKAVVGSPLVGAPGADTPLILDGALFFFRRFQEGEQRIASTIRERLPREDSPTVSDSLRSVFRKLFPPDETQEVDWQAMAAAAALRSRILCIAGGPGTGKTTTILRVMATLLEHERNLSIALSAPTGKAANRLAESISAQIDDLPVDAGVRERIPRTAATLHRLLGYHPSQARFAFGEERRLETDVLIVDEASMIDQGLFAVMLSALPPRARLILVGDPDQLPSVDAGFVFGDLCRAGGSGISANLASFAGDLGLSVVPAVDPTPSPMQDAVITLTRTYRFAPDSGIRRLAYALRDGHGAEAVAALRSESFPDIRIVARADQNETVRAAVRPFARALLSAETPSEALASLNRMRMLTPLRIGPQGTRALNAAVEEWLLEDHLRPFGDDYTGKPILINTNDYGVSLFNGDVGVLWKKEDRMIGCFAEGDSSVREVARQRLPAHEAAWAMTVHKSQGSEFDHVLLILPEGEHAGHLTRELLYTAVTRARTTVTIVGDPSVIEQAALRREVRVTGLRQHLEGGSGTKP